MLIMTESFPRQEARTRRFTLGVPRTESSAWNGQSRRGKKVRDTLGKDLDHTAGKVKVLNDGITMAGKSGRIPITISNGLAHGTVTVKLHAYSKNDTLLRVNGRYWDDLNGKIAA